MRISIAMATFNGAAYLLEQLDSFVSQDRLPDELVVCDDGSSDETVVMLDEFKLRAPFDVIVIQNERNLGFTKNFEKALSNCSGDLIFLSDQDDIWFPVKIGVIEKAFLGNPDKLLVIHNGELVDENLVSHGVTKLGQIMAGYGSDARFVTGALTAIRRDMLPYALPIPEGIIGHDGWLHYIVRVLGKRQVLDQSLQFIRRHASNTSEWIANSSEPISRLAVARDVYSIAPPMSYQDRLPYCNNLIDRIHLVERTDDIEVSENLIKSIGYLKSEHTAIIKREMLLHLGFIRRKFMAIKMLVCGDYQHFNGINSFLRDLLR